jgi:hypothetical protein
MVIVYQQREGTQESKPSVVDFDSSKTYVYLRRNIERTSRTEEEGNVVFFWSYEEAKLTHEEYEQYIKETEDVTTAMMMQQFNDLVASQELSDITVEMNHEEEMQLLNDIQADIALITPDNEEEP